MRTSKNYAKNNQKAQIEFSGMNFFRRNRETVLNGVEYTALHFKQILIKQKHKIFYLNVFILLLKPLIINTYMLS